MNRICINRFAARTHGQRASTRNIHGEDNRDRQHTQSGRRQEGQAKNNPTKTAQQLRQDH